MLAANSLSSASMDENTSVDIPDGAEEMMRTTSLLMPFNPNRCENMNPRSNPTPIRMQIVRNTGAGMKGFGEKWMPSDNITRGIVMYPVILKNWAASRREGFTLRFKGENQRQQRREQTHFLIITVGPWELPPYLHAR